MKNNKSGKRKEKKYLKIIILMNTKIITLMFKDCSFFSLNVEEIRDVIRK